MEFESIFTLDDDYLYDNQRPSSWSGFWSHIEMMMEDISRGYGFLTEKDIADEEEIKLLQKDIRHVEDFLRSSTNKGLMEDFFLRHVKKDPKTRMNLVEKFYFHTRVVHSLISEGDLKDSYVNAKDSDTPFVQVANFLVVKESFQILVEMM